MLCCCGYLQGRPNPSNAPIRQWQQGQPAECRVRCVRCARWKLTATVPQKNREFYLCTNHELFITATLLS
eukprot:NODE_5795_length_361_cov_22.403846_g4663_i0.p2 GENE.NODE_5795_length_361_cov_22.403846_g4663_i0~~NODE_5795_length_361_cov_22.403846_g4663_i0.p2  ORF type:complete len:70 (-),score=5.30 NODE_5795_length_361_cov_22.403846_g4663_i0:113-322(-)